MYIIRPIYSNGSWKIEIEIEEFGRVLLLDPYEDIPIPISFDYKDQALEYIHEYSMKFNIL